MIEIYFEDIECLEKLSKTKKLTETQRKVIKKFIRWYFQVVD